MKKLQLLLKVILLFISLSVASLAEPTIGYFSSQGVKFEPRDFIIVHEEDEGRIRLHFTDLSLSEDVDYKYNGLQLTPKNGGFLLQTRGPRGSGPREVLLDQSQSSLLASQVEQAARHLGILK